MSDHPEMLQGRHRPWLLAGVIVGAILIGIRGFVYGVLALLVLSGYQKRWRLDKDGMRLTSDFWGLPLREVSHPPESVTKLIVEPGGGVGFSWSIGSSRHGSLIYALVSGKRTFLDAATGSELNEKLRAYQRLLPEETPVEHRSTRVAGRRK